MQLFSHLYKFFVKHRWLKGNKYTIEEHEQSILKFVKHDDNEGDWDNGRRYGESNNGEEANAVKDIEHEVSKSGSSSSNSRSRSMSKSSGNSSGDDEEEKEGRKKKKKSKKRKLWNRKNDDSATKEDGLL
jgi:hypothetical protein